MRHHEFQRAPRGTLLRQKQLCAVCEKPSDEMVRLEYEEVQRQARQQEEDYEKE